MIMGVKNNMVNESMSAGYVSSQYDDSCGFSYSIMPLSFNLQQKGNSPTNDKNIYKHYVGDHVLGMCPNDKKIYTGVIRYFIYDPTDSTPRIAYIVDDKSSKVIPVTANSVKQVKYKIHDKRQLDYFKKNQNKMTLLDVQGLSECFNFNIARSLPDNI